jgi:hypothetical protein
MRYIIAILSVLHLALGSTDCETVKRELTEDLEELSSQYLATARAVQLPMTTYLDNPANHKEIAVNIANIKSEGIRKYMEGAFADHSLTVEEANTIQFIVSIQTIWSGAMETLLSDPLSAEVANQAVINSGNEIRKVGNQFSIPTESIDAEVREIESFVAGFKEAARCGQSDMPDQTNTGYTTGGYTGGHSGFLDGYTGGHGQYPPSDRMHHGSYERSNGYNNHRPRRVRHHPRNGWAVSGFSHDIGAHMPDIQHDITQGVNGLVHNIGDNLPFVQDRVNDVVHTAHDQLPGALRGGANVVSDTIGDGVNRVVHDAPHVTKTWRQRFSDLGQGIYSRMPDFGFQKSYDGARERVHQMLETRRARRAEEQAREVAKRAEHAALGFGVMANQGINQGGHELRRLGKTIQHNSELNRLGQTLHHAGLDLNASSLTTSRAAARAINPVFKGASKQALRGLGKVKIPKGGKFKF